MTEPRDDYTGEGGDGSDASLPDNVPAPDPDAEEEDEEE